jgi:hypothetical protein
LVEALVHVLANVHVIHGVIDKAVGTRAAQVVANEVGAAHSGVTLAGAFSAFVDVVTCGIRIYGLPEPVTTCVSALEIGLKVCTHLAILAFRRNILALVDVLAAVWPDPGPVVPFGARSACWRCAQLISAQRLLLCIDG